MTDETSFPPGLLAAYRATHYRVEGSPAFTLRIGQRSWALLLAHAFHRLTCSACVTACNPYSVAQSAEVNATGQQRLASGLRGRSLPFVPAIGSDPDEQWPAEPGFLVFGPAREAARRLGAVLEQNAIVWCGVDGVPRLELLL